MSERLRDILADPEKVKELQEKDPKQIHQGPDGFEYHNAVKEGSEVIPMQELDNITDQRTFDEVEADEREQWRVMHTKLHDLRRDSLVEAKQLVDHLLIYTFHKHGASSGWRVKQGPLTWEELEKRLYKDFRIRVAKHRKSQHDEFWEAGHYIYVGKELVAFISDPVRVGSQIVLSVPFYLVRTNVDLPGGKGVIH